MYTQISSGHNHSLVHTTFLQNKRKRMGIDRAELVFIPLPAMGHLISMVEVAKLMVARDQRVSITVLVVHFLNSSELNTHLDSLSDSLSPLPIRFVTLSRDDDSISRLTSSGGNQNFFPTFLDLHKNLARDAVATRLAEPDTARLAGFVVDLFCTSMMDVADEFGVPSYVFFTSGAAFLGLMLHLMELNDERGQYPAEFKDSDADLIVPSYRDPVPIRVLPALFLDKEGGSEMALEKAREFRRARGILVNTFEELESHALDSFPEDFPPVYPVGPILNLVGDQTGALKDRNATLARLNEQPPRSVVFLCFGSMGSFDVPQVHEIARGLERSRHRFLWALRRPPPKDTFGLPSDYEDVNEVLPEGFSDRTAGVGKVIGWAPQVAVLSHPAIGGFVSHCGWNSTLEGLWFGVPIATWPMYAEQQINAFQMVREFGLSAELTLDYKKEVWQDTRLVVGAGEIERGIRCVMEQESEVRKKVRMMSEASRGAVMEGGSSFSTLGRFLEDAIDA